MNEHRRGNLPGDIRQYQIEVEFYVNDGVIKKAHDRAHSYVVDMTERIADTLKDQTIHIDSPLYATLRDINEPDLNHTIDNLASMLDHVEVTRLAPHNVGGGFDALNEMFFDDDNKCISSKYTENVFDYLNRQWSTKYSSEYIAKYYRPKACLYTVIDIYKTKFAKCPKYRNEKLVSDLTYENLYHMIHGIFPNADSSWGLTLNMVITKFFAPYKIGVKVLDIRGNILHSYIPTSINNPSLPTLSTFLHTITTYI